jgi:hypothetical protein
MVATMTAFRPRKPNYTKGSAFILIRLSGQTYCHEHEQIDRHVLRELVGDLFYVFHLDDLNDDAAANVHEHRYDVDNLSPEAADTDLFEDITCGDASSHDEEDANL